MMQVLFVALLFSHSAFADELADILQKSQIKLIHIKGSQAGLELDMRWSGRDCEAWYGHRDAASESKKWKKIGAENCDAVRAFIAGNFKKLSAEAVKGKVLETPLYGPAGVLKLGAKLRFSPNLNTIEICEDAEMKKCRKPKLNASSELAALLRDKLSLIDRI